MDEAIKRYTQRKSKFEIYRGSDGEYRWRFRARNGEIVASGEGYKNYEDCLHAVDLLRAEAKDAELDDQTREKRLGRSAPRVGPVIGGVPGGVPGRIPGSSSKRLVRTAPEKPKELKRK